MAQSDHGYRIGSMDISDHKRTWAAFVTSVKWVTGAITLLMILLAIFRTH